MQGVWSFCPQSSELPLYPGNCPGIRGLPWGKEKSSPLVNAIKVFLMAIVPWLKVGCSLSAHVAFCCISNLNSDCGISLILYKRSFIVGPGPLAGWGTQIVCSSNIVICSQQFIMKIFKIIASLKACYSEHPHTCHLDPTITVLALSPAQPSIYSSICPSSLFDAFQSKL